MSKSMVITLLNQVVIRIEVECKLHISSFFLILLKLKIWTFLKILTLGFLDY